MSKDNPCGEIHPLPCGVDKDCGYLENYVSETELRELVEELQDKEVELSGANERVEGYEYARKRIEQVLEDG